MCGEPRQFVSTRTYLNQWGIVMRVTWTSVFSNTAEIEAQTRLISRHKKSASVRQVDIRTNFNPIWPRQKLCSSTTKNRLVRGSLNFLKTVLLFSDYDECGNEVHKCQSRSSCVNTAGSYQCQCKQGFFRNGPYCIGKDSSYEFISSTDVRMLERAAVWCWQQLFLIGV